MSRSVKISLLAISVCLFAAAFPMAAAADDLDAGFSVSAVIPENQLDSTAAYFDLKVAPGHRQDLIVAVENPGEDDIVVTVEAITASTNRNGIINYSTPGLYDETLPFAFSDIAEVPDPRLEIPPHTTVHAKICMELPEVEFAGTLLGAIRVVKLPDDAENDNGIVNQFSYAIGVRLTQHEEAPAPEPEFDIAGVSLELVNHKAAIVAGIRNTQPVIVKGAHAAARIYRQGETEPVIEKTQQSVNLAPHSIFPMTLIDQAGYGFDEGDYTASIHVEYLDKVWSFEQAFTIERAAASVVNGSAVNQVQAAPDQGISGSVAATIALCAGAAALLAVTLRMRRLRLAAGK